MEFIYIEKSLLPSSDNATYTYTYTYTYRAAGRIVVQLKLD